MAAPAYLRTSRASAPKTPGRRSVVNLGAEHENLDQKAYQILKTMIMDRQLLPGGENSPGETGRGSGHQPHPAHQRP